MLKENFQDVVVLVHWARKACIYRGHTWLILLERIAFLEFIGGQDCPIALNT